MGSEGEADADFTLLRPTCPFNGLFLHSREKLRIKTYTQQPGWNLVFGGEN